jgi:AraC-like DNA-binding protein
MSKVSVAPLIEAVRQLELGAQQALTGETSFLVACGSLHALRVAPLPSTIHITPSKTRGPGIVVSRARRDSLATTKFWPQDGLVAYRSPLLCGVLAGQAMFQTEEYSISAPTGSMIFVPAGVAHPDGSRPILSGTSENDFCDLLWLYRWEGGIICHICHSRGTVHANFEGAENSFLTGKRLLTFYDFFAEAIETTLHPEPETESTGVAALAYLLPALLAMVGEDLQAGRYVQPGVRLPADSEVRDDPKSQRPLRWKENYGAIAEAQSYILHHLALPLSVDHMAQRAFMSRSQFTRRFRQATGCSFVEYLTTLRLERAKQFLMDTNWSVEIIAQAVGMRPSHFWDVFARRHHITPGEFRSGMHPKMDIQPPRTSHSRNRSDRRGRIG